MSVPSPSPDVTNRVYWASCSEGAEVYNKLSKVRFLSFNHGAVKMAFDRMMELLNETHTAKEVATILKFIDKIEYDLRVKLPMQFGMFQVQCELRLLKIIKEPKMAYALQQILFLKGVNTARRTPRCKNTKNSPEHFLINKTTYQRVEDLIVSNLRRFILAAQSIEKLNSVLKLIENTHSSSKIPFKGLSTLRQAHQTRRKEILATSKIHKDFEQQPLKSSSSTSKTNETSAQFPFVVKGPKRNRQEVPESQKKINELRAQMREKRYNEEIKEKKEQEEQEEALNNDGLNLDKVNGFFQQNKRPKTHLHQSPNGSSHDESSLTSLMNESIQTGNLNESSGEEFSFNSGPDEETVERTKKHYNTLSKVSTNHLDQDEGEDSNSDGDVNACPYGAKCYRSNPQHFINCSHPPEHPGPGLVWSSTKKRPICRFGADCYQTSTDHMQKFSHR